MKERIQGALRQAINAESEPETKRFYLQTTDKTQCCRYQYDRCILFAHGPKILLFSPDRS